jgi:pyrroline-5-carboxylate reductase
VLSILAGAPAATVREALGGRARVVRVMPNTPALVGRGMTALAPGPETTADDRAFARAFFGAVGTVIEIDEARMDAFTAVAGSGPAYVFLLAEALAAAGAAAGLDAADALLAARETIAGAGVLLGGSAEEPAALRRRVTSPGGTTVAALAVFEDAGLREIVARAVLAARDRGAELARLAER